MTNTQRYTRAIIRFQDARNSAQAEYEEHAAELERYKGSKFYEDELAKAKAGLDARIAEARQECTTSVNNALEAMRKALQNRKLKPPTQEQLAILQALKMRETITQDELDQAAQSMGGNGLALGVVQEIARKQGIFRGYASLATDSNAWWNPFGGKSTKGFGGGSSSGNGSGKPFATGLDYVPYNDFAARLHEGEAVLTKTEATEWRKGGGDADMARIVSQAVIEAVAPLYEAVSNIQIVMDGRAVGNAVSETVSRNIAKNAWNRRYQNV